MKDPQTPQERTITDAVWAEIGTSQPDLGGVSTNSAATKPWLWQVIGGVVLLFTISCCILLLLFGERVVGRDGSLVLVGVVGGLGVAAAVILLFARRPLFWFQGKQSPSTAASTAPHIAVIYTPAPDVPDPLTLELEERLLHLCKQDRRVFERLMSYERSRNPGCHRAELLRLAIEHFERDIG